MRTMLGRSAHAVESAAMRRVKRPKRLIAECAHRGLLCLLCQGIAKSDGEVLLGVVTLPSTFALIDGSQGGTADGGEGSLMDRRCPKPAPHRAPIVLQVEKLACESPAHPSRRYIFPSSLPLLPSGTPASPPPSPSGHPQLTGESSIEKTTDNASLHGRQMSARHPRGEEARGGGTQRKFGRILCDHPLAVRA